MVPKQAKNPEGESAKEKRKVARGCWVEGHYIKTKTEEKKRWVLFVCIIILFFKERKKLKIVALEDRHGAETDGGELQWWSYLSQQMVCDGELRSENWKEKTWVVWRAEPELNTEFAHGNYSYTVFVFSGRLNYK